LEGLPARARNGRRRFVNSLVVPTKTPLMRTFRPLAPPDWSWQLDHSSSGAVAIHSCQAPRTSAAAAHRQLTVKRARAGMGCTAKVNEVTMPKFPPPPPRLAQYRSAFSFWLQTRARPSEVTICKANKLSQVSPYLRPTTPMPPP